MTNVCRSCQRPLIDAELATGYHAVGEPGKSSRRRENLRRFRASWPAEAAEVLGVSRRRGQA